MVPARSIVVGFGLACFVSASALAQSDGNPMPLSNGSDVSFVINDPSIGGPPGAPDPNGDLFWRVVPKEALYFPTGSMRIVSVQFEYADTDWSTAGSFYDLVFAPGKPGPDTGTIAPDLASPGALTVSFGPAGALTNPCLLPGNPFGCSGPCPPPGALVSYAVEIGLGTPIGVIADGTTDLTVTEFVPGGMSYTSGAPGTCGTGDFVQQAFYSTNEKLEPLPIGKSPYGGFQVAPFGPIADQAGEVLDFVIRFGEPTVQGAVSLDNGSGSPPPPGHSNLGLAGLRVPVTGQPANSFKFEPRLYAEGLAGHLGVVVGSVTPMFPLPGFPLLGAYALVDFADPVAQGTASVWQTTILPYTGDVSWVGDDVGLFAGITVPPVMAGLELHLQGFTIGVPAGVLTLSQTGAFTAKFF